MLKFLENISIERYPSLGSDDELTSAEQETGRPSSPEVARQLIQQFASHQKINTIASTAVVLGVTGALWSTVPAPYLVGWAALQVVVGFLALWRWQRFVDISRVPESVGMLRWEATLWKALSGGIWGMLAVFMHLYLPDSLDTFVTIVVGAVAVGGIGSLASILAAACAFATFSFLPVGTALGLSGGIEGLTLAILSVVYTGMLLSMAVVRNRMIVTVFNAREENRRIAREFETSQQEWLETSDTADAFALFGKDDRLLMWNDRCARLLKIPDHLLHRGVTRAELLRQSRQPMRTIDGKLLREQLVSDTAGPSGESEDLLEYEGGIWLRRQARLTKNGQLLVSFADLTDTVKMSQALRESERRYREIAELSPEAILIHVDDTIVYANAAAVTLFRAKSLNEIIGASALNSVHPDDRVKIQGRRKLIRSGQATIVQMDRIRRVRLDGSHMITEVTSSAIDWLGKPAIMIMLRDITMQVETEQRLRDSEERLRAVVENLPGSVILKDRDLRIRMAAGKDYNQWSPVPAWRVIGKRSWDILPPKIAEELERLDRQVLESGQPSEREIGWRVPDGSTRTFHTTRFPVRDADGKILGVGVINQDVTEQQLMEEQFRQAQKMETVGQLTGGVAHDFNNLLTVIQGNLELLTSHIDSGSYSDKLLSTALRATERGADLTQHLLAFSRRQSLNPEPVDIKTRLSNAAQLLRRTLPETISIVVTTAEDLPSAIIDPTQLDNAILNLVVNARDAMEGGGRITLSADLRSLDNEYAAAHPHVCPGEYIRVVVHDTGIGMDREVLTRVFEPFFTTKPVGAGTGLGLSMVYGFVSQSGGHVEIESEPGFGTEVCLYLPIALDRAEETPEPVQQPGRDADLRGDETVLVVEDDPDVRVLVIEILGNYGYKVIAVVDGPAAIEAMRENGHIDVLLSDVVLPNGMLGPDIAREIANHHPQARILLMSGYTRGAVVAENGDFGEFELLRKPFTRAQLLGALRGVLDAPASTGVTHTTTSAAK